MANGAGWNNTPVTVTYTCIDPKSVERPRRTAIRYSRRWRMHLASHAFRRRHEPEFFRHGDRCGRQLQQHDGDGHQYRTTPPTISSTALACRQPAYGLDADLDRDGYLPAGIALRQWAVCHWARLESAILRITSPRPRCCSVSGANQSVSGAATDVAGNVTPTAVRGINIDQMPPVLTEGGSTPLGAYVAGGWTNQNVTVTFICVDNLGPDREPASRLWPRVDANYTGQPSPTATVTLRDKSMPEHWRFCQDQAGNVATTRPFLRADSD